MSVLLPKSIIVLAKPMRCSLRCRLTGDGDDLGDVGRGEATCVDIVLMDEDVPQTVLGRVRFSEQK
jgi:hypothetical protein